MKDVGNYQDLKEKILELLNTDRDFAYNVYRIVVEKYGKDLVTKSYLDEALLKQSEDLKREFYDALARQSEDLKREFYSALAKQSEEFDRKLQKQSEEFDRKLQKQSEEFDRKLQKQSEEFDRKLQKQSEDLKREFYSALAKQSEDLKREFYDALARQSEDLKRFIDNKVGVLGHRWGEDAELAIRNFASEIVKEWGGVVRKWSKEVKVNVANRVFVKKYEIDVVISDGKEMLVEVKSSCGVGEIERFMEAVMVYEDEVGHSVKDRIIVSFFVYSDAMELAQKNGIKVITV